MSFSEAQEFQDSPSKDRLRAFEGYRSYEELLRQTPFGAHAVAYRSEVRSVKTNHCKSLWIQVNPLSTDVVYRNLRAWFGVSLGFRNALLDLFK